MNDTVLPEAGSRWTIGHTDARVVRTAKRGRGYQVYVLFGEDTAESRLRLKDFLKKAVAK